MPTVLRVGGFSFGIYSGDHEPAHVHVWYAGKKCRIVLETLEVKKGSMKATDRAHALRIVASNREVLSEAWTRVRAIKGDGQ